MDNNFIELTTIDTDKFVVNFQLVIAVYEALDENGMKICKLKLINPDNYIRVKESYEEVKLKLGVK